MRRLFLFLFTLAIAFPTLSQDEADTFPTCTITNADLTSAQRLVLGGRQDRMEDLNEMIVEFDGETDDISDLIFDLKWWAVFAHSAYIRFPFEDIPECAEYQSLEAMYRSTINQVYALTSQLDIVMYLAANPRIDESARENVGVARAETNEELVALLQAYTQTYAAVAGD